MALEKSEYLSSLTQNIGQFREAAALGLNQQVAACPEWTVGQLVVHMGEVYDFWSKIVDSRAADEAAVNEIQEARAQTLDDIKKPDFYLSERALSYFDEKATAIQQALTKADPTQPNWTWWPGDQTAGFVQRRMCHETTIHRWDCQAAHGVQTPIVPPIIAADGVDEELNNELTGWGDEGKTFPTASFHIHCADTEGEWLVVATGTTVEFKREHAKADVAITGSASDLVLWLWHRTSGDRLTVHGESDLAPQLRDMLEQD